MVKGKTTMSNLYFEIEKYIQNDHPIHGLNYYYDEAEMKVKHNEMNAEVWEKKKTGQFAEVMKSLGLPEDPVKWKYDDEESCIYWMATH